MTSASVVHGRRAIRQLVFTYVDEIFGSQYSYVLRIPACIWKLAEGHLGRDWSLPVTPRCERYLSKNDSYLLLFLWLISIYTM